MAKWKVSCSADGKTWSDTQVKNGYDLSEYAQQSMQNPYPHLQVGCPVYVDDHPKPADPPSVKLTYARNAENGLSFYANGLPVGAIANRDLVRLIQQAAELLQAGKAAE